MPVAASASLSGTVSSSAVSPGSLITPMELQGGEGLLEGTVERSVFESMEGESIGYRWSVKLDGEWLPQEDLADPFEVEESIDSHVVLFSFGLVGPGYSVAATTRTWTRTPVEVWVTSGRPGSLRQWCRAAGYVLTCDQQLGPEPMVRVSCADASILYDSWELCHEVPPGSGLTRGAICAELAADAGITATDIPPGAVFNKPFQALSTRLFEALKAFGEPESWSWRFRTEDGVLEAYTAGVRREPEPPDHVWTYDAGDYLELDTSPPREVPSRWIIRGNSIVLQDESLKRTLTRTEVEEIYAPKVCPQKQNTDGSIAATGAALQPEALRVTSVIEDQQNERAGRLELQLTKEYGWFNPAAGKLRTPGASEGAGPVEDGFYWTQAFIDEEGSYRGWPRESFVQVGERRQMPDYDGSGTATGGTTDTFRWMRKTMGVRSVGSATPNAVGAAVGDDDQSYYVFGVTLTAVNRIEDFGHAQRDVVRYEYSAGAARKEVQETLFWRSIRTAVAGVPWWVLYDGTGQQDLVASWGLGRRRTLLNLLSDDQHLTGKIETEEAYSAPKRVGGTYDWGDYSSNRQVEAFGPIKRTLTQFNVVDAERYEEIVEDGEGPRFPKIIQGRLPLPRFETSVWTAIVQQPMELVVDDPVLESWFGFRRETLTNDYIQDLAEAARVLARRRSRALAFTHQVVRLRTMARPGDTVLLADRRADVHGRCLVTKLRESWTLSPRTAVLSTYTLEEPL